MESKTEKFDLDLCTEESAATDVADNSTNQTSASSAEVSIVTPATAGTLSQSAYLELREKLLASGPKKTDKPKCSPEIRRQKMIEAMQKKRIPKEGGRAISDHLYGRRQ